MAKCKVKDCPEIGYPWFSGCCSKRHQSAYQRECSRANGSHTAGWSIRPSVNRVHGHDNRKASHE